MGTEIQIAPELETGIAVAAKTAVTIKVVDQASRDSAVEFIKGVKGWRKKIVDFFEPMKTAAYAAHKVISSREKTYTDVADAAERTVKNSIIAFDNEQEKARIKEQARLQAIADEDARKERQRLMEEASRLQEEEGKSVLIQQAAMVMPAPVVVLPTVQKSGKDSTRKVWKARVIDEELVPRRFLTVNMELLDAFAMDTKGSQKVDGVEFYEQSVLAIR